MVTLTILTDHLHHIQQQPKLLLDAIKHGPSSQHGYKWQPPGIWTHPAHHRTELAIHVAGGQHSQPWQLSDPDIDDAIHTHHNNPRALQALQHDAELIAERATRAAAKLRAATTASQ